MVLKNVFGHLKTINDHRRLVRRYCFKVGLYKQGLLHDLSKYSKEEFIPSVNYFQGNRSPITAEKEEKGISECWLHHKGRNKHHWEYWVDHTNGELVSHDMPFVYLLESVLDKLAASKIYQKEKFVDSYPYDFFCRTKESIVSNPEYSRKMKLLLAYYRDNGEDEAFKYYKSLLKEYKKNKTIEL